MAKLNFRNEVKQYDVDEALKLMDFSIRSLRSMKEDKNGSKKRAGMNFCILIKLFYFRKRNKKR